MTYQFEFSQNDTYSDLSKRFAELSQRSSYNSDFNPQVYQNWLQKGAKSLKHEFRLHRDPFQLINLYSGCQNCHQGFQLDPYGFGCLHDCLYCFAKVHAEENSYWNEPLPVPLDVTEFWHTFYTIFETSHPHPWRSVLEKRIPLRLGGNSDPFMHIDRKFGISKEVLKILNYYKYPHMIVTRSDLLVSKEYIDLLDPKLCSVHLSIPSKNYDLLRILEPGAPDYSRRLETLRKLNERGIWTTVRVNPLFPMFPDGFLCSGGDIDNKEKKILDFFQLDLIDELAKNGCQSVLVGMVTLKRHTAEKVGQALGVNLFHMLGDKAQRALAFRISSEETSAYYREISKRCRQMGIEFTTCYLGTGEPNYYAYQDLWSNKSDCCNVKGRVPAHTRDSLDIKGEQRVFIQQQSEENSQGWLKNLSMKILMFMMRKLKQDNS